MTTLISGGAYGADKLFEDLAKENNHNVAIFASGYIGDKDKEKYDQFLIQLNHKYLNRTYPTRNEYVNGLLRRDVLIGIQAEVVFSVSTLDKNNTINGGTAWASYTFINKYKFGLIPFYLFDQNVNIWYQISINPQDSKINFNEMTCLPKIPKNKVYAGIGTRELNNNGKNAIYQLYKD